MHEIYGELALEMELEKMEENTKKPKLRLVYTSKQAKPKRRTRRMADILEELVVRPRTERRPLVW